MKWPNCRLLQKDVENYLILENLLGEDCTSWKVVGSNLGEGKVFQLCGIFIKIPLTNLNLYATGITVRKWELQLTKRFAARPNLALCEFIKQRTALNRVFNWFGALKLGWVKSGFICSFLRTKISINSSSTNFISTKIGCSVWYSSEVCL